MKANNHFIVVAMVVCAGVAGLLTQKPLDEHPGSSTEHAKSDVATLAAARLRPSLAETTEPSDAQLPDASGHDRFAFVRHGVGPLRMPWQDAEVLVSPDSWSVEVNGADASVKRASRAPTTNAAKSRITRHTLKSRLAQIAPAALPRVMSRFQSAKVPWPPTELAYVGIKDEKALELYAKSADGKWQFVHRYRVLGASGHTGPKLARGDKQVPEGIYRISYLNPNSAFHVSLRVSFPNAFDRAMAAKDGRKDLGGDIMIHGKNLSAGCLAMGDQNAEELFVLAQKVGLENVTVVIAPTDLRRNPAPTLTSGPAWTPKLYSEIADALGQFKAPEPPSLLSLLGL
ncbi:MAG: murein L,D-transpeptidase family protein [Hyphomicrobiaceae bacterium]